MCIKTRVKDWNRTGLLFPAVVVLYALLIFPFIDISQTGREIKAHVLIVTGLLALSTLYALYLSPQARQVRRQIVAARYPAEAGLNTGTGDG
jgi:hypothetical protein